MNDEMEGCPGKVKFKQLIEWNERLCAEIKVLEKVIQNKEQEISKLRSELSSIRSRIDFVLGR